MPRYVRLTQNNGNVSRTVYINYDAIEGIFETENGARVTLLSGDDSYIDVIESAEYVKRMTEEERESADWRGEK